jgi:hypothetical protein
MSVTRAIIEKHAKYWRDIIKRDKERNRFAYALKQREILKEKDKWFSVERTLEKKKKALQELIKHKNTVQEEKIRLARTIGLTYNLDLSVPAATRLITWSQEVRAKRLSNLRFR